MKKKTELIFLEFTLGTIAVPSSLCNAYDKSNLINIRRNPYGNLCHVISLNATPHRPKKPLSYHCPNLEEVYSISCFCGPYCMTIVATLHHTAWCSVPVLSILLVKLCARSSQQLQHCSKCNVLVGSLNQYRKRFTLDAR